MTTELGYRSNEVKRLRRLLGRHRDRLEEGVFVVEGATLVGEALSSGAAVEAVYAGEAVPADLVRAARRLGVAVHTVGGGVMDRVATTVHPQPVLAVVGCVDVPLAALSGCSLVVVCADLRDPGNAGTVLRSAEAAGVEGVIFCQGSVDVYNPKTVRASAGSLFHVPIVSGGDAVEVLASMGDGGLQRLGAAAHGGRTYTDVDLRRPTALVLGNEAHGLSEGLAAELDSTITIPMAGRGESLNVGMAAAVLCFEAARQRRSQA